MEQKLKEIEEMCWKVVQSDDYSVETMNLAKSIIAMIGEDD